MRFKTDENLHDDVAALPAGEGHDVHTARAEGLRGCADAVLAQHCRHEERSLVRLDLDFADIRVFPPAASSGMIVLRVADQSRQHILDVVGKILNLLKSEPVAGRLWIVSEAGVRIRE